MHSSRMRAVRCNGRVGGGGVCPGDMSAQGVFTTPLWTEFLTHADENITFPPFPQLLLRTVKIRDINGNCPYSLKW